MGHENKKFRAYVMGVEKPLLTIGLISSCPDQCALVLSPSQRIASLHVSFTAYEYFYKTI